MIGKVGGSTSVAGTSRYLQGNAERVGWKDSQHLASEEEAFVIAHMEATAEASRTDQPIYHYSISWDEADHPSRGQMQAVARQTLRDLGMGEHQALIVAHNDREYPHLHVMVNRVHPKSGKAWDKFQDYVKLEKSLRTQERQHGWREVPGHHCQLEGQTEPAYGQSLNRKEAARVQDGQQPFYANVGQVAGEDFRQAKSWEALHQRLAANGLTIQRGSRGTGGKITDGHSYANLSKIHRDFSMNKLEQRFGKFRSLEQINHGKGLSHAQQIFAGFEKAWRLNKPAQARELKQGLGKSLKAAGTAKKVHGITQSMLSITTPSNPAFKAVKGLAKTVTNQLQRQQETGGLERSLY